MFCPRRVCKPRLARAQGFMSVLPSPSRAGAGLQPAPPDHVPAGRAVLRLDQVGGTAGTAMAPQPLPCTLGAKSCMHNGNDTSWHGSRMNFLPAQAWLNIRDVPLTVQQRTDEEGYTTLQDLGSHSSPSLSLRCLGDTQSHSAHSSLVLWHLPCPHM